VSVPLRINVPPVPLIVNEPLPAMLLESPKLSVQ